MTRLYYTLILFFLVFTFAAFDNQSPTPVMIHVALNGDDQNDGSESSPLKSLEAAQKLARLHSKLRPVEVVLADGIYYLPETFILRPEDSGTVEAPVVYRAENEGSAVISGGSLLDLNWELAPEVGVGVYKATTPPGLQMDQLFINGQRQHMARYPNYNPDIPTAPYQGFSANAFTKERAGRWADPEGGYIHAMHVAHWGGYHYRITGKDKDGEVTYVGGWQNNRQMGMHDNIRMVENIFEELDAPNEWFHNQTTNTLYYMPEAGTDLSDAMIEVVRLRHLVELQGTEEEPVKFITLEGFTFRHTSRTFMDTKEPLLRSDWTVYRGGAVLLTGTEHILLLNSTFDQPGGNAVFVNQFNRRVTIRGCHIHDAGASGVLFVGDSGAVRNPLFEYGETSDLTQIDRTPGPKTNNYPADCIVEDCLIHGIGRVERQPAGVQVSMSRRITIRDVSIYDCARAGINISEGTWGGHLIERVDVFETVLETGDHGSFNSWGRDRFWVADHRNVTQPEVKKDPSLPFLDAMETTVIRDSRWRCDHGWDIDLDDGSSNYIIYNNLMLAGGLKLREGYGRKAFNNIHINNGLHAHVWFENSGDDFTRNIVMAPHAPVRQPEGWGAASDRNFFVFENDLIRSQEYAADPNSIHGDPKFADPLLGDFSVKENSPAFKIGFVNFPMDQFGVKKPSLRAIARTPEIPVLLQASFEQIRREADRLPTWLGMSLRDLKGEEFSAFGVSQEQGGVHLIQLSHHSQAGTVGLQRDDLIQQINGQTVRSAEELLAGVRKAGSGPIRVTFVRNQRVLEVVIPANY
ncbi:MAG: right-handed parallel beta-helix repeat-containing protein [Cyclobacteriaceae bacterium]|nr:right-handed parallel beta-helix repeat-containing protein [Cyclobacteriaceae bacterium]